MRIAGLLQAVTGIVVVVVAIGCAATKEYSSKLFAPRDEAAKDSQEVALRFLDLERLSATDEGWVDTKIIRDSVWKEHENSAEVIASQIPVEPSKPEIKEARPVAKPISRTTKSGTKKAQPIEKTIPETIEAETTETEPLVKTVPVNGTRNKTTRD